MEMYEVVLILCLGVSVVHSHIPTYNEKDCDRVITLGLTSRAGRLIFNYRPNSSRRMCNITMTTIDGQQMTGENIAYAFLETTAQNNFKCTSFIYYDNGYTADKYCGNNVYPKYTQKTRDRTLTLSVVGDGNTEFMFDLLFLSFHNGSCFTDETKCNGLLGDLTAGSGCVDYSLVCHETYTFCEASGTQCGDIVSEKGSNGTVIAVIVVTIVLVLLVALGCYLCYRNDFCGFLKRNPSEDDVRRRAMNVFTLQLASRGVDGNDNNAYADDEGGPIDYSKFDLPPEYGSLEHLDNVGATETGGNVSGAKGALPSYGDVMNDFDNYSVTTPI